MQFTAKSVEEAVRNGLETLNITESEADIVILEQPTKGFFGRIKGNAVVDIVVKEKEVETKPQAESTENQPSCQKKKKNCAKKDENLVDNSQRTTEFVSKVLELLNVNAQVGKKFEDNKLIVTVEADNSSMLIGRHGEVIDAVQTLAGAVENIGNKVYKKVVVDCEDYRVKREETLVSLAKKLEAKATDMRREVILEPMSPYERRIIHTALADSQTVTTRSDGKEPNRYVVIVPNDKDEFSKPYNASRNNDKKNGRSGRNSNDRRNGHNARFNKGERKSSGFSSNSTQRKKTSFSFGTYLGNSIKDEK